MKEQLIELSKQVSFLSRDSLIKVNDNYYYLWMCELQKWLRDVHNVHIEVTHWKSKINDRFEYLFSVYFPGHINDSGDFWNNTYEEALEEGLKFALNYILENS